MKDFWKWERQLPEFYKLWKIVELQIVESQIAELQITELPDCVELDCEISGCCIAFALTSKTASA